MKKLLLACAIVALVLPAAPRAQAADVSVDFFYNNLSGGSWIEVGDYGYCWQPDVGLSADWRPYSDGYWAYTDLGWTWVSYEDFGWATYHYGRWVRLSGRGWVWVPGRDGRRLRRLGASAATPTGSRNFVRGTNRRARGH